MVRNQSSICHRPVSVLSSAHSPGLQGYSTLRQTDMHFPRIVTFYLLPDYEATGIAFADQFITWSPPQPAAWKTCYQLPDLWNGWPIGSVQLSKAAQGCWVYPSGNSNCAGDIQGTDFTAIDATTPGVAGGNPNFGKTASSVQCLQWTN
jgi:hypothetical protein